jgi:hypothetical protein
MEACLNGAWTPFASGRAGSSAALPAASCEAIKNVDAEAPSGVYWLDGGGAFAARRLYCDMVTLGGGWTYVARGSDSNTQNNAAYNYPFVEPDLNGIWHLSAAHINALTGAPPYETYVRVGRSGPNWDNLPPAERDEIRIRRENAAFTFEAPMFNYAGWNGSSWITASTTGSSSDRGPAWEPGTGNLCCEIQTDGTVLNCRSAPANQEGQWSNLNTNQHLRCFQDTTVHDGLVIFVR